MNKTKKKDKTMAKTKPTKSQQTIHATNFPENFD